MITVRIMRHIINPGDKYGRLTVLREVQKAAADGRRYRAALCRCDCGEESTPRISSLRSGDAQSCGCSRGPPKYGEGNPRAKLTSEKVRQLRARRADGLTYRQLATEFGISDVSACAAVNRKTWAHVN